jgi:hypothetical protein
VTDYAVLVRALYDVLGTWQAVADACNNGTQHSAGYFQQVARGRIRKPGAATAAGIERATECPESLLKCDFSRVSFKTRIGRHSTRLRLKNERNRRGEIARGGRGMSDYPRDFDRIFLTLESASDETGALWCEDQVTDDDVEYVNVRLYAAQAERIAELEGALRGLVEDEESGIYDHYFCVYCYPEWVEPFRHDADCPITVARKLLGGDR